MLVQAEMESVGRERKNQRPGRGKANDQENPVCLRRESAESAQGQGEAREGQVWVGQGRVCPGGGELSAQGGLRSVQQGSQPREVGSTQRGEGEGGRFCGVCGVLHNTLASVPMLVQCPSLRGAREQPTTSTCHCFPRALTTRPSMGLRHAPQMGTPVLSWQGRQ